MTTKPDALSSILRLPPETLRLWRLGAQVSSQHQPDALAECAVKLIDELERVYAELDAAKAPAGSETEHYEVEQLDQVNEGRGVWLRDDEDTYTVEQAYAEAEVQLSKAFMGQTRIVRVRRRVIETLVAKRGSRDSD